MRCLIDERHVPALRQNHELRPGDLFVHLLRERRVHFVVIAHDESASAHELTKACPRIPLISGCRRSRTRRPSPTFRDTRPTRYCRRRADRNSGPDDSGKRTESSPRPMPHPCNPAGSGLSPIPFRVRTVPLSPSRRFGRAVPATCSVSFSRTPDSSRPCWETCCTKSSASDFADTSARKLAPARRRRNGPSKRNFAQHQRLSHGLHVFDHVFDGVASGIFELLRFAGAALVDEHQLVCARERQKGTAKNNRASRRARRGRSPSAPRGRPSCNKSSCRAHPPSLRASGSPTPRSRRWRCADGRQRRAAREIAPFVRLRGSAVLVARNRLERPRNVAFIEVPQGVSRAKVRKTKRSALAPAQLASQNFVIRHRWRLTTCTLCADLVITTRSFASSWNPICPSIVRYTGSFDSGKIQFHARRIRYHQRAVGQHVRDKSA